MHQQTRSHQRVASPSSSAQTNTSRTNHPREGGLRSRTGSSLSVRDVNQSTSSPDASGVGPYGESIKKLDQIVQNIFIKASALILHSRTTLRPIYSANSSRKTSKWFQADTDDFDEFREDLQLWRSCGSFDHRPPPLFIDIYLDTAQLKRHESLVLVDDIGKRWDTVEMLNSYDSSSGSSGGGTSPPRTTQIVLERWRIELKCVNTVDPDDFGPILPTIYKKAIVFIRSIYTYIHLLPSWRLVKQSRASEVHPALIPRCRIRAAEFDGPEASGVDRLRQPLTGSGKLDAVTDYVFGDLEVPVGRFYASVTYRTEFNCKFRIDDSEAVMGSRFIGIDDNFFHPSVPQRLDAIGLDRFAGLGSLPTHRQRPTNLVDIHQTYGSLSTFHGDAPLGTSPISALRAVRPPGSDTSSESTPASPEPEAPNSLPASAFAATIGRPPLRPTDYTSRRQSLSFQPFKSGPLSTSPVTRPNEADPSLSPNSIPRPPTLSSQPRNRTSLIAGMPASLRGVPTVPEQSLAGSPRTATGSKFSSSFSHRRGRPSVGGTSRAGDDEQGSSGRQSLASSVAQPGSGLLTEVAGTSTGSLQASDDNIAELLRAIDSKKTLKSLDAPLKRGDLANSRASMQLSRFQMMKESNYTLIESMTSSAQMQRSSSSSIRQPIGALGVAPLPSTSESSSPGKPISPHAPHTPAIPSRLSENSIIAYDHIQTRRSSSRHTTPQIGDSVSTRENTLKKEGSTAIDIPLSPRLGAHLRRSGSVVHQKPRRYSGRDDGEGDPAFLSNRSISLGANDREPPSVNMLLGIQIHDSAITAEIPESASAASRHRFSFRRAATEIYTGGPGSVDMIRQHSSEDKPPGGLLAPGPSSSPYGRRRYVGMTGTAAAAPSFSPASLPHRHPISAEVSVSAASRQSNRADEVVDDEPLVFSMSEMDAQSRRSIEEGRGSGRGSSGFEGSSSARRRPW